MDLIITMLNIQIGKTVSRIDLLSTNNQVYSIAPDLRIKYIFREYQSWIT
jgi:hypothetical protein